MVGLIEASAPTLPLDTTLDPTMIPDRAGFAFFSRPIVTKSAKSEEEVLVYACLWGPSIEPSQVDQGAIIAEYSYFLDPVPPAYANLPIPCGFAGWIYGQPLRTMGENWDLIAKEDADLDPNRMDGSVIGDRLNMTAFWLLSAQPGVAESLETALPRPTIRRSERAKLDPKVRVIYLRAAPNTDTDATNPTYRHRWIVSGHWRQQACGPKQTLRRPIWIAPHLKGPDGAPLLRTDNKVKAWVR
jgi:hypothetical protein